MNNHLANDLAHARLTDLYEQAHQSSLVRATRHERRRLRSRIPSRIDNVFSDSAASTMIRLIHTRYALPYRQGQQAAHRSPRQ